MTLEEFRESLHQLLRAALTSLNREDVLNEVDEQSEIVRRAQTTDPEKNAGQLDLTGI